jgi:hypothetical protein
MQVVKSDDFFRVQKPKAFSPLIDKGERGLSFEVIKY